MRAYIHLEDPSFCDPPFAGGRRLGPFESAEEALEDAAHQSAGGHGTPLGVWSEEDSDASFRAQLAGGLDALTPGDDPVFSKADIESRASEITQERAARVAREQMENREALRGHLASQGLDAEAIARIVLPERESA